MLGLIKKLMRKLGLFFMFCLAVSLVALMSAPYFLNKAYQWIDSDEGQENIALYIEKKAKQSGVNLDIQRFKITLNPKTLKVKGTLEGIPFTAQTVVLFEQYGFDLKDFRVDAPEFTLRGGLAVNPMRRRLFGKVEGHLNSLSPYRKFVAKEHKTAPLRFSAHFKGGAADIKAKTASYTNEEMNITLKGLELDGSLSETAFILRSLTLISGEKGGRITVKGRYDLADEMLDFDMTAQKFFLTYEDILEGVLNANLKAKGTLSALMVSGDVKSEELEINLPDRFDSDVSAPQITVVKPKKGKAQDDDATISVDLDLIIDAPNRIFVRGMGLDAELGGRLHLTQNMNNPYFDGSLSMIRGRYRALGKPFKLKKVLLLFDGYIPPEPDLDIIAETTGNNITARIAMSGNVNTPEIDLSSTPYLPEDEIVAQLLFGKRTSELSPIQALELSQALASLTGVAPASSLDPLRAIRNATGLDDLRVEMDEDGETTVGAGTYLREGVYLELEAGSGENSGAANLEIELTPNITLESKVGQDAKGGAGVFWKWDY